MILYVAPFVGVDFTILFLVAKPGTVHQQDGGSRFLCSYCQRAGEAVYLESKKQEQR